MSLLASLRAHWTTTTTRTGRTIGNAVGRRLLDASVAAGSSTPTTTTAAAWRIGSLAGRLPTSTLGRSFSTKHERQQARAAGKDAFFELGLPQDCDYNLVKGAFLKIAMQHHPDTSTARTPEEVERHKDIFCRARTAFESIVQGPDGKAILKHKSEEEMQHMDEWFRHETGHDMPYMDAQTMKEVAEMTESSEIGLDRDGGMWTLAKMVTNAVKDGGDAQSLLRLEAGTTRDRGVDGVLRRKRRR